jgi:hypothetical protein
LIPLAPEDHGRVDEIEEREDVENPQEVSNKAGFERHARAV